MEICAEIENFLYCFFIPKGFASPKETNVQPQPSQPPVPPLEDDDESRSSGSGESTPMSKKAGLVAGDPYRAYTDLRSDSIVSANSTLNENEEDAEDGELKHRWASFNNRHHNNGVDQVMNRKYLIN